MFRIFTKILISVPIKKIFCFHFGKGCGRSGIPFRFLNVSKMELWNFSRFLVSRMHSGNIPVSGTYSGKLSVSKREKFRNTFWKWKLKFWFPRTLFLDHSVSITETLIRNMFHDFNNRKNWKLGSTLFVLTPQFP